MKPNYRGRRAGIEPNRTAGAQDVSRWIALLGDLGHDADAISIDSLCLASSVHLALGRVTLRCSSERPTRFHESHHRVSKSCSPLRLLGFAGQKRADLVKRSADEVINLMVFENVDRMRHFHESIPGRSLVLEHGPGRVPELICYHGHRRQACPLHFDGVEHTARTARPSVTHSGDDKVASPNDVVEDFPRRHG